jgi:hypothetical protein
VAQWIAHQTSNLGVVSSSLTVVDFLQFLRNKSFKERRHRINPFQLCLGKKILSRGSPDLVHQLVYPANEDRVDFAFGLLVFVLEVPV